MHVSHINTCVKSFILFILYIYNLAANQTVQKKKYTFSTSKQICFIFVHRGYTLMLQPPPVYSHRYVTWSRIKHSLYIINNNKKCIDLYSEHLKKTKLQLNINLTETSLVHINTI